MSLTFIDTNKLPKKAVTGQGEVTEVLNDALCGAKNVLARLRWLKAPDTLEAEGADHHQLIYVMDGKGCVLLNSKEYIIEKGSGIYLGPSESANVHPSAGMTLKLFHLVVPKIPQ